MYRFLSLFIFSIFVGSTTFEVSAYMYRGGMIVPSNYPPIIKQGSKLSLSTAESTMIMFTLESSNPNRGKLIWTVTKSTSNSTVRETNIAPGNSRSFNYTPKAGYYGVDNIVIQVSDGALTDSISVTVSVKGKSVPAPLSVWVPSSVNTAIHDLNIQLTSVPSTENTYQVETRVSTIATNIYSWKPADATFSNPPVVPVSTLYYRISNVRIGPHRYRVRTCNGSTCSSWTYSAEMQVVNDTPTISAISNQTIDEDTASDEILIGIFDRFTAPEQLRLLMSSDNSQLIDSSDIEISGNTNSRTIRMMPKADQSGTALIQVTVSDGSLSSSSSFQLTVNEVNDAPVVIPPALSPVIRNQTIELSLNDFKVVDNDSQSWQLAIENGIGYTLEGNKLTVTTRSKEKLYVPVSVTDNGGLATLLTLEIPVGSAVKVGTCDLVNQSQAYQCESCIPQLVVVPEMCSLVDSQECEPNE